MLWSVPTDANAAANTVAENAATGTVVGVTALATDADAGTTISYSLTDNAGGRFAINATTGVVTVANGSLLDYETATSHNITVLATSSDGSTNTATFTVNVADAAGVTLNGDANANSLVGTIENDILNGLEGNDLLQGLARNDLLDGGLGFDRAIYTDATDGITVNLAAGTASGAGVGTDTLISIEGTVGSDFVDTFNAAGFSGISGIPGSPAGFNEFEGRGGNDSIIGAINSQGQMLTRISYVHATAGVTVDVAAGTADGNASVDHDTFSNVSVVWGSNHNDFLYGSNNGFATFELFEGRAGDDWIEGRSGYDRADYNNDPATTAGILVNLAAGTVESRSPGTDSSIGNDTLRSVEAVRGTVFDDIYDATNFGISGNDNVGSSGTFNDFAGVGGNDIIIGNGTTRLNYSNAIGAVTVNLETSAPGTTTLTVSGTATGTGEGTDTFSGVNAALGSIFNDSLTGSNFGNTFVGNAGDDFIDGLGGFDTVSFNHLSTVTSGVSVNMAAGTATGDASIGTDTLSSIESIQGTSFADSFVATGYGNGLPGTLNIGNNGNFNQFEGLGGNDLITGNGSTQIVFFNALAGVTVNLANGTAVSTLAGDAAGIGSDTITGGVNNVQGSNFDDTITGGVGNEVFAGGTGNDTLNASGGSDAITGGGGSDTIDGGGGADVAVFFGARVSYAVNFDTPVAGQVQVVHSGGGGADGTDVLSNIEVLQFTDSLVLMASGTAGSPVDVSGLFFGGNGALTTLTGASNDFLTIGQNLFNRQIDLGAGAGDTVTLGVSGGYTLNLVNVENLAGTSSSNDFVGLTNLASGLAVDLGAGANDMLSLANGFNSLSVINVENVNGNDFAVGDISDDTITLLNNVFGVTVNLGNGTNTINLAAGTNTLVNAYGTNTIHGTESNDTLTVVNGLFQSTVDLGGGTDTLVLTNPTGFSSLGLVGVESVTGGTADDYIVLQNAVTGVTFDLGIGNDTLNLVNGANSVGAIGVETINGSDFGMISPSNDTLTLLNSVNGIAINLGVGTNTLNLAAGVNTLAAHNIQTINGSIAGDSLTLQNQVNGSSIDLGGGVDLLTLADGFNAITVTNVENVIGGNSNDSIVIANTAGSTTVTGGLGSDTITGGAGNDIINGGGDNDNLTGGAGADTFVYTTGGGSDFVNDFNRGQGDRIDVTGVSGIYSLADIQSRATQVGCEYRHRLRQRQLHYIAEPIRWQPGCERLHVRRQQRADRYRAVEQL